MPPFIRPRIFARKSVTPLCQRQGPGVSLTIPELATSIAVAHGLPFVIVLAAGLLGVSVNDVPRLSSWVMGALTLVSTALLAASISDCVRKRIVDVFWLFITGSASLFWGSVFLESLR